MSEKKPIYNPEYWRDRLRSFQLRHQAIYVCGEDVWKAIEDRHRVLLRQYIKPEDSVLDAGCGWGRLLTLLPDYWKGDYLGVDLCPDFLELARHEHPSRDFVCGDFRELQKHTKEKRFDWAVLISIRPMIINNIGEAGWEAVRDELQQVCDRILFLEYVTDDKGEILES